MPYSGTNIYLDGFEIFSRKFYEYLYYSFQNKFSCFDNNYDFMIVLRNLCMLCKLPDPFLRELAEKEKQIGWNVHDQSIGNLDMAGFSCEQYLN